jgi:hypothetical protein
MKFIASLMFSALFMGISAHAASFSECPAVGNDTNGCELLITVTAASGGVATAFSVTTASPDQGPYDGIEDTLLGVLNKSGSTLTSLSLASNTTIFGFDGDGACTYISCPGATDPNGYAPAGVTFSGINSSDTSGTVNFSPGLTNGGSSWFSLEEALTASSITNASPEPSSILLFGLGLAGLAAGMRRKVSR